MGKALHRLRQHMRATRLVVVWPAAIRAARTTTRAATIRATRTTTTARTTRGGMHDARSGPQPAARGTRSTARAAAPSIGARAPDARDAAAPPPDVDTPDAPPPTLASALKIMFDPVGRGKQRKRALDRRDWSDFMMTSHAAFLPAIGVVVARGGTPWELAALQSIVLATSLAYHRQGERPGAVARVEGSLAKALFAYGAARAGV